MPAGLILAGAKNDGPLREYSQASNEALIEIEGKPMIEYIFEALRKTEDIDRIVVVGPETELTGFTDGIEIINGQGSIMDNLDKGLNFLQDEETVLILTSDIPMITEKAISDFLLRCSQREGDLYYPVNSKEISEKSYPGVSRTFVKIKDGTFTGGNIFLVRTESALRSLPKAKEFISMRKKPLKLAGILGISFILRLITRTLTIRAAEVRVSQILGLRAVAIISPHAEIGVDVDKPEDLELARSVIKKAL